MAKKRSANTRRNTKIKKAELVTDIVSAFNAFPEKTFNYRQMSALLKIGKESHKVLVNQILYELSDEDFLSEISLGKFRLNQRGGYITGTINREGVKTFLLPDDGGEPVFIPERKTNHALLGDKVKVFLFARRRGMMPEGEVLEILERAKDTFVGILTVTENYAFLAVDSKVMTCDIFIPKDKLKNGKNGQKAVAKIVSWEAHEKNPIGEIVDILGNKGNNNAEMHAILAEFGLPYFYPKEVENFAEKMTAGITCEETARRRDMRETITFTIDPRDAKDFDDALSVKQLKNGNWEIGVHIADVTHYVTPDTILEKEAYRRATSVYLVDRTIPMLPEHLSNGICSLRPNEDKLTYSVVFEMNEDAEVIDYQIIKTVINSDRRFTYEEAQTIIETGAGDFANEVLTLDRLAKKLREIRFTAGAIAFDRIETRFEIDENGKPISVFFKEAKDSNKLVEEFMLLANKTVAEHIGKVPRTRKAKTFVYRIHDLPDAEKLQNFSQFIRRFGYSLKTTGKHAAVSTSINNLLDKVQGKPEQNLVETLAIRSMAKAIYSTKNIGHYGLAFPFYTHFTSPIRRYPDMMVHRLLERYADGGRSVKAEEWEEMCKHSSQMENVAASAERASIKYKQVEFMAAHLGQVFEGVISGVTEWGVYVEILENKCEGMIPIRYLDGDYYTLDEKNYCLVGRRHHRKFQLGDTLKVRIARADLDKKQLDFQLEEDM